MEKTKAEVIEIIKGALSGGPDAIADALSKEGCIAYNSEEGGSEEEVGDMGMEDLSAPLPGQDAGITGADSMKDSRSKATDFALKAVDAKAKKKPGEGGNPFAK